jgi:hypothetical protein
VFRIYAKGKRVGWRVKEGDDVMFYYVEQPGRCQVSQVSIQRTRKRTCPGSTKSPSHSKYNRCGAEVNKLRIAKPNLRRSCCCMAMHIIFISYLTLKAICELLIVSF